MDYGVSEARLDGLVDHESAVPSPHAHEPPTFSGMERSVIQLSRKDSLASIPDLWDWRVGVARLFAVRRASPLANQRLEELRRFAILVRIHDDPGDDALDRFLDAGFTIDQAALVHRLLREGRSASGHRRSKYLIWVVLLMIPAGIYAAVQSATGDPAISLITAALGLVTIVSFTAPRR